MKETNATGRHAAPPPPPPVKEKKRIVREKPLPEIRSRRTRNSVIGGFALLVALLIIFALSVRGAAEEQRYRQHLRAAEECIAAEDYENALGHLRQALQFEETEDLHLRMVDCYEAMGSYDKALEQLRRMDLNDESIRARIGRLEDAKEELRRAGKIVVAGMELDRSVSSLIIRRTDLSAEDLARVAELYGISSLSLTEDGLTDIAPLAGLGGLTMLDLSGNGITDLQPLSALGSLRTLYLDRNPIEDFSPLYVLDDLSMLSIREIEISEEQLKALSDALPHCAIHSETATAEVRELTLGGATFREDVTELDLSDRQLSDLSALSACRQLKSLDLSGNEISDLSPLMDLPYLEELDLADNRITDLRPLMAMRSLQRVDVSGNAVASTAPLSMLDELRALNLQGNALTDLSGLEKLTGLEKLNLESTGLTDDRLSLLPALSGLKELDIENNPELTGEAVEELKRTLPRCTVTHSKLVYTVEINGTRYRRDLTELDVSGVGEPFDLSGLHLIATLETLRLSGDGLQSIYDLETLVGLRELDLSDNRISDLTPLAYMTKLDSLNLSNNRISSATALLNLTQLKELDLRGNELSPDQLKRLEDTLINCTILHD